MLRSSRELSSRLKIDGHKRPDRFRRMTWWLALWAGVGSLLWLSTVSTILAFFAYLTLLGRVGAALAGYTTVMFPLLALGISTLFETYQWSPMSCLGLVLVLAGNVMALRRA